jgi:hypothetical protein
VPDLLGKCARTLEFTIARREGVFSSGIASAAETTSFSTRLSCFSKTEATVGASVFFSCAAAQSTRPPQRTSRPAILLFGMRLSFSFPRG